MRGEVAQWERLSVFLLAVATEQRNSDRIQIKNKQLDFVCPG